MRKLRWIASTAVVASLVAGAAFAGGRYHGKFFQQVDQNKDGKITKPEAQAFGQRWFAEIDSDKNGSLTRSEVEQFQRSKWGKKNKGHEHKGKNKGHEHKGKNKHHGKHVARMFEKLDANGDGQISKPEAQAKADRMFQKFDTNNDGAITKAELRSAKKGWKEKRDKRKRGNES